MIPTKSIVDAANHSFLASAQTNFTSLEPSYSQYSN